MAFISVVDHGIKARVSKLSNLTSDNNILVDAFVQCVFQKQIQIFCLQYGVFNLNTKYLFSEKKKKQTFIDST